MRQCTIQIACEKCGLAQLAAHKARGYAKRIPLAQRSVFQSFLGEADQKLKAARALMMGMRPG